MKLFGLWKKCIFSHIIMYKYCSFKFENTKKYFTHPFQCVLQQKKNWIENCNYRIKRDVIKIHKRDVIDLMNNNRDYILMSQNFMEHKKPKNNIKIQVVLNILMNQKARWLDQQNVNVVIIKKNNNGTRYRSPSKSNLEISHYCWDKLFNLS